MTEKLVNLSWRNSRTKESWHRPLTTLKNNRTWYSASYYTGPYHVEKPIDRNLPKTVQPDAEIDIDTGDPRTEANYIDRLCTHVAYGIYNGGFWVYVPPSVSKYPVEIPERLLWYYVSGERVSDTIYESQEAAIRAAGGVDPNRFAYYVGVGGKVTCPTAFTYRTAPTIVNTARIVVDELVAQVTEDLKGIVEMLLLRVALSTGGALLNRAVQVRRLKARDSRAKVALDNARAQRKMSSAASTIRPRATKSQLREMLQNPNDWYVWATHEAGIVENELHL